MTEQEMFKISFPRESNHDVDELTFELEVDGGDLVFTRSYFWMDIPGDRSREAYWINIPSIIKSQLFAEYMADSDDDLLELCKTMPENALETLFKSATYKLNQFRCWSSSWDYNEYENETYVSGYSLKWTSESGLVYENREWVDDEDGQRPESVEYILHPYAYQELLSNVGMASIGDLFRNLIQGESLLWEQVREYFITEGF
jgi:hypothetical protein